MNALWKHEMLRVFSDKLTTEEDKSWFEDETNRALEKASRIPASVISAVKNEKKSTKTEAVC